MPHRPKRQIISPQEPALCSKPTAHAAAARGQEGVISQTTKFGYRKKKKKRKGKACLPWLSSIFQSTVVALTSLQNVLKSVTLKRKFGEREGVVGGRLAGSQGSSSKMKLLQSTHWS